MIISALLKIVLLEENTEHYTKIIHDEDVLQIWQPFWLPFGPGTREGGKVHSEG